MINPSTQSYTLKELERLSYIGGGYNATLFENALQGSAAKDICVATYEVSAGFPGEDCLQDLIDELKRLSKGRATKAQLLDFLRLLEDKQSDLTNSGDFGRDELRKLESDLKAAFHNS